MYSVRFWSARALTTRNELFRQIKKPQIVRQIYQLRIARSLFINRSFKTTWAFRVKHRRTNWCLLNHPLPQTMMLHHQPPKRLVILLLVHHLPLLQHRKRWSSTRTLVSLCQSFSHQNSLPLSLRHPKQRFPNLLSPKHRFPLPNRSFHPSISPYRLPPFLLLLQKRFIHPKHRLHNPWIRLLLSPKNWSTWIQPTPANL